jgi:uncharacterized protein
MTTRHFPNPIITIFSRKVRPGFEDQYQDWIKGINAQVAKFQGSQGATVLRSGKDGREFHTILQFETPECLEGWLTSNVRAQWLEKLESICVESEEVNSLTGMERWFTLPSQSVSQAPPRYKSATLLLLGLYPLSFLIPWLMSPIVDSWPSAFAKLLTMIITIILMVWLVMPQLTKLFFWWLYPEKYTAKMKKSSPQSNASSST